MFPKLVENVAEAAALLEALANPARLKVMSILITNELSVGMLADQVGLSQSALSQHLAKLRKLALVTTRREAQTIYYRCDSANVRHLLARLSEVYGQ